MKVIRASLSAGRTSTPPKPTVKKASTGSRVTVISRPVVAGEDVLLSQSYDLTARHENDEFNHIYNQPISGSDFVIIEPTFNPKELAKLPIQNNTLGPCIAAMVTNIDGFGHTFEFTGGEEANDTITEDNPEAQKELRRLKSLAKQPNPEELLPDLRAKVRKDIETIGWAGIEVVRGGDGRIVAYYHVPAHMLRMTTQEKNPVEVEYWIERDGEFVQEKLRRKWRRYVQITEGGKAEDRIFFKEFGDERLVNPKTGQVDPAIAFEDSASEMIFLGDYTPGQIYPLPRWLSQLPSILGSWESELVNLQFFRDNGIPAALLLVSGGILSQQTISDLRSAFTAVRGKGSMNRVAVIEAQPHPDFAAGTVEGSSPTPKMELKSLNGERQQDSLFKEYDLENQAKVRSAFRLPPLFLGRSTDYTRATAEASIDTAESQVFGPEREKFDAVMNMRILLDEEGRPPRFWKFRSNPSRITNKEAIVNALDKLENSGAMTPNQAIALSNEMFSKNRKSITDAWGDLPFTIVLEMCKAGKLNVEAVFESFSGMAEIKDDNTEEEPTKVTPPVPAAKAPVTAPVTAPKKVTAR